MHVLNLDGSEANVIEPGKSYLVPTLHGIPVVWPSHVDEGTSGRTSRHYHADYRFQRADTKAEDLDLDWLKTTPLYKSDPEGIASATSLNVPTVFDDGREPHYQEQLCTHSASPMSGEIFSSLCWLYLNLGDIASPDGKCVHHATDLHYHEKSDCLRCPAHGLRYKVSGEPFYRAPFWLRVGGGGRDEPPESRGGQRVPLTLGKLVFEHPVGGTLYLEDDEGTIIDSVWCNYYRVPGTENEIEIKAWPKGPSATKFKPCMMGSVKPMELYRKSEDNCRTKVPGSIV